MGWFSGLFKGPSLKELGEAGDLAGLWKALTKKGITMAATIYERLKEELGTSLSQEQFDNLVNLLWDWAVHIAMQPGHSEVLFFAKDLCDNKQFYAGTGPLTPAAYLAQCGTGDYGEKRERKSSLCSIYDEAFCPVCEQLLTEKRPGQLMSGEELGMYRVCGKCGRHYHRECAAGRGSCSVCSSTDWKWSLRSPKGST